MSGTAEEALAAFARDLVEEIAAGRALELAQDDPEALELVSFNVRPFQRRSPTGKMEQVRGHTENRFGTGIPGDTMAHPGNLKDTPWIPEPDWAKGEKEWTAKGEAIWKKNEWKSKGKPKSVDQMVDEMAVTRQRLNADKSLGEPSEHHPAFHLKAAESRMLDRGDQAGQMDQNMMARAYHELSRAHEHIVRKVLPHAQPEHYPDIAQHLQKIAGHMQDLDRALGANPEATRKLLGDFKENFAHAGEERRAKELAEHVNRTTEFEQGEEIRRKSDGKTGKIVDPVVTNQPGSARNRWYAHFPGEPSDRSYSASELDKTETGTLGQDVTQAGFVKKWQGKRVRLADGAPEGERHAVGGDLGTVVDAAPEKVWDAGAEGFIKPHPGTVLVRWDSHDQKGFQPRPAYVEDLQIEAPGAKGTPAPVLAAPPPPGPLKGASAVHPQLHGKHVTLPGDTLSGHAHAHVPKPFEVKQPTAQDKALGEAHAALAAHRRAELQQIADRQAAARAEHTGIPAPGTYAPLTDEQFAQHTANLERAIGAALEQGLATNHQFTEPGNRRIWTPDRAMAHADIVKGYLDKQVNVPADRAALFMGGLPGAGKSTLLKNHPGIDLKNYAVINPDDFKEELARRGMVPEVEGLSPMERAALVHEESVHLANLAAAELQRRGKNLAYDVTMKSYRQTSNRVKWLKKDHGYHVTAVFVDVPVEKSVQRVAKRYRRGLEAYRQGKDKLGGRYVPVYAVRSGEGEPGQPSRARATFDSLRPHFNRWELYDGSKGMATLVDQGGSARAPGGITSVEDLIKQQQAKALDTSASARAAEKGTAGG